jgi:hypothetical protein
MPRHHEKHVADKVQAITFVGLWLLSNCEQGIISELV